MYNSILLSFIRWVCTFRSRRQVNKGGLCWHNTYCTQKFNKISWDIAVHDYGDFETCQLPEHEQGLLDKLVKPVAMVLCQSTAMYRPLTLIGLVRAPRDHIYKIRATFLDKNLSSTTS